MPKLLKFSYQKALGNKQAVGGQVRVAAQIFEYLSLELINSYDSRFHENFQGSVGVSVPFGPKQMSSKCKKLAKCKDFDLLSQRLVQPVKRQEIIVVDRFRRGNISEEVSVAINQETKDPYIFWFVDNTSSSLGTYDSPFSTLLAAQDASRIYDIIYVFPGNGTAQGTNAGIILQDSQQLLGSSTSHVLNTTLGMITIPSQTSLVPIIGNTAGTVVSIVNNNVISGFNINSITSGSGILNIDPISNLTVTNNAIITATDSCIDLNNVSGDLNISNNTMTTGNFSNSCVSISNTGVNSANYSIQNNVLNTGYPLISLAYIDSSAITTNVGNNFFINDLPVATIALNNTSSVAEHVFEFSSNTFYSQDDNTIAITLSNFANASIYCNDNELTNLTKESSNQAGISMVLNNNSLCNLNLNNNNIQSAYRGVGITANDESTFNMLADQNFFGGGDEYAFLITTQASAIANASFIGNTLRSIDEDALKFISNSTNSAQINIVDNSFIATAGLNTINCTSTSSGTVSATIKNNDCSFGILSISNQGSGNFRSVVDGNLFTNAVVSIENTSTGTLCQQFNNNTSNITQYLNGANPYIISNTHTGTLNLEPLTENVGFFTLTDITYVNPNSCQN